MLGWPCKAQTRVKRRPDERDNSQKTSKATVVDFVGGENDKRWQGRLHEFQLSSLVAYSSERRRLKFIENGNGSTWGVLVFQFGS